ncbi:MAG: type IV pilus modification protein PilV [Arenicellales bacterium]|nr:type IV pilus modification protein PilV [Arenicellales bacterium]
MTYSTNTAKGFRYHACLQSDPYSGSDFNFSFFTTHHALASSPVMHGQAIHTCRLNYNPPGQRCNEFAVQRLNQKSRQIGASLVEVMISLLILSMGLLGMAALQGLGTQYGNEAYFRSQAIVQTYDMIDRMRANPSAVAEGKYELDPIPTSFTTDCIRNKCATGDLANFDLVNWNQLNKELLPAGAGSVTRQGGVYTVRVTWQEDANDDGTAETQSFSLSARLW